MAALRLKFLISLVLAGTLSAAALTPQEERLAAAGYRQVRHLDPRLRQDLMYAREDNFTGMILYDSLHTAFLHPEAARALAHAQGELSRRHPELHILVKDAARPLSVQRQMFNRVRGTAQAAYVANPDRGAGTHNYGLAVDVTLCDSLGRELPMGTTVDHLGPEAHITDEEALVRAGKLSREELENRRLLRGLMTRAGFKTIRREWWHFELLRREQARGRYPVIL